MKVIAEFPNYSVDREGRVFSYAHGKRRRMSQWVDSGGYPSVDLYKCGKRYKRKVHRLVAEAFIPNPENKREVNHKDGERTNSRAENLEWVTPSENQIHAYRTLKRKTPWGGKTGKQHCCSKPITQYTLGGVKVQDYDSAREAAKDGFSYKNISGCCRGERKKHMGFIWKFKDEGE